MTDLSGKFDYNGLKSTLRENGIKTKDLNKAIRQVESDNHIDSIKDADEKQSLTISSSIFNGVSSPDIMVQRVSLNENPFENSKFEEIASIYSVGELSNGPISPLMQSYNNDFTFNLAGNKIMGDGSNIMDLPEPMYDIDEYEEKD